MSCLEDAGAPPPPRAVPGNSRGGSSRGGKSEGAPPPLRRSPPPAAAPPPPPLPRLEPSGRGAGSVCDRGCGALSRSLFAASPPLPPPLPRFGDGLGEGSSSTMSPHDRESPPNGGRLLREASGGSAAGGGGADTAGERGERGGVAGGVLPFSPDLRSSCLLLPLLPFAPLGDRSVLLALCATLASAPSDTSMSASPRAAGRFSSSAGFCFSASRAAVSLPIEDSTTASCEEGLGRGTQSRESGASTRGRGADDGGAACARGTFGRAPSS